MSLSEYGSVEELFMSMAAIDSPSTDEDAFFEYLYDLLQDLGIAVAYDYSGNIVASASATELDSHEHLLFACHGDKVSTGRPIVPVSDGERISSDGQNSIGADNKAAIACLIWAMRGFELPIPIEIVITRNEENGLVGARAIDTSALRSKVGLSLDGESLIDVVTSAQHWFQIEARGSDHVHAIAESMTKVAGVTHVAESTETRTVNVFADTADAIWETQRVVRSIPDVRHRVTAIGPGYSVSNDSRIVSVVTTGMRAAGISPRLINERIGNEACIYNARGIAMPAIGVDVHQVHETDESVSIASMRVFTDVLVNVIALITDGSDTT